MLVGYFLPRRFIFKKITYYSPNVMQMIKGHTIPIPFIKRSFKIEIPFNYSLLT